ncbi:MAG TPA: S1C family serine protease [Steroidobacteraceae bacterium]
MPAREIQNSFLQDLSDSLANIREQVGRSVVGVYARRRLPSSGFVWAPGIIVTAAHTIRRDRDIQVLLPAGGTIEATLAGQDPGSDLAVLKIADTDIPAIERGESDTLRAGNLVLALARLRSDHVSLDYGLVAAVGAAWRTWRGAEIDRLVALDGGLRPGFSGGPIADAGGRVVGMGTSALARGSGVVIPLPTIAIVAEELLTRGQISRGYLGLGMQPVKLPDMVVTELSLGTPNGLLVASVAAGGPAEQAGIQVGDVLLTLAGQPCTDTADMLAALARTRAATALTAEFVRGGQRRAVQIMLGERPRWRHCG